MPQHDRDRETTGAMESSTEDQLDGDPATGTSTKDSSSTEESASTKDSSPATKDSSPARHSISTKDNGSGRTRTMRKGAYALGLLVLLGGGGLALRPGDPPQQPALTRSADQRANRSEVRPTVLPTTDAPTPVPTTPPPAPATAVPTTKTPTRAPTPTKKAPQPPVVPSVGCTAYTGNKLVACNILPEFGYSTGEMSALVPMWQKESGWSVTAANSSGAYGIPQALPGSKMASVASDWRTNPATQIRWGLSYIKGRYGSPSAAWAYWQAHGWY